MVTPSHTRYTAPAAVRAVSNSGERATEPPPGADHRGGHRMPGQQPPTAGSTVRCRSPAAIAYAQFTPAVITSRKDTAQNATTVVPCMANFALGSGRTRPGAKPGANARKGLPTSPHGWPGEGRSTGAGARLPRRRLGPERLRVAVAGAERRRSRAQEMGRALRAAGGAPAAADALEAALVSGPSASRSPEPSA